MRDCDDPLAVEFVKEQAEALGLAGEHLRKAIVRYRKSQAGSPLRPGESVAALLDEVTTRASNLMLQREVIGFTRFNTEWIVKEFDLPPEAVDRLAIETAGWKKGRP